jgi:hypothetical protein
MLCVVLYGCGTLSIAMKEEHRLRVFENRVLKRTFGSKRGEVTGVRRKFYEWSNYFYSSSHIVRTMKLRRMRWVEHVSYMGEINAYRICWKP